MSRRKKYQINLFSDHIDLIINLLEQNHADLTLIDFINTQKIMHDKNDELSRLNLAYDKILVRYEGQQTGIQH